MKKKINTARRRECQRRDYINSCKTTESLGSLFFLTSPTLDPSLPGFPVSPDSPGLPCDEKRVQMDISLRESRTANETEPLAISFGCLQTLSKQEKEKITEIILLLNWGDLMADPFFNELPFFKNT